MATFKLRRNTAAQAASNNPILEDGEPGFAKDTRVLKIGDGTTPWNDLLPIVGGSGVDLADGVSPTVFWGVFAEGSEPTPPNDGKIHYGFRTPAP